MKKILLSVEVPDGHTIRFIETMHSDSVSTVHHAKFKQITLPNDEEIHANAVKYHESMGAGWTGVSFEAGAKWMRDKIFKEEQK